MEDIPVPAPEFEQCGPFEPKTFCDSVMRSSVIFVWLSLILIRSHSARPESPLGVCGSGSQEIPFTFDLPEQLFTFISTSLQLF